MAARRPHILYDRWRHKREPSYMKDPMTDAKVRGWWDRVKHQPAPRMGETSAISAYGPGQMLWGSLRAVLSVP